jgi:hypothetical protein
MPTDLRFAAAKIPLELSQQLEWLIEDDESPEDRQTRRRLARKGKR